MQMPGHFGLRPAKTGGSADIGYNSNGEFDSFIRKNTCGAPLIGETYGYGFDPIGNRLDASIDGNLSDDGTRLFGRGQSLEISVHSGKY